MSGIKIYPPKELPAEGVTDTQFAMWTEKLEIYLEIEEKFRKFLPGGTYDKWLPAEDNSNRIETPHPPDTDAKLPEIRRELRQFIAIIAELVHQDYYNPIMKHSTSLTWIYKKIRQDYNIEHKGIHFMNILDLKFDSTGQTTAVGFYNQYRSMIIANLAKKNDVISWKNEVLKEDEKLSPSYEDLVLLNVLHLIHPQLPAFVREQYAHKIADDKRLMDYKTEILTNAKRYIADIEAPQINQIDAPSDPECAYVQTRQLYKSRYPPRRSSGQPNQRFQNNSYQRNDQYSARSAQDQPPPFCRLCHVLGMPKATYTNHYLGQPVCPSISQKDKQILTSRLNQQLGALHVEEDVAELYGYEDEAQSSQEQVKLSPLLHPNLSMAPPQSKVSCNYIEPVPTQILSLKDKNDHDIHITLDTGATVSYIKLEVAKSYNLKIGPNAQLSKLADGKTKMPAIGEIDEHFYRNDWSVRFNAIVVKDLHADIIGGNNFIKENKIIQDLDLKTITVHKRYTVPETSPSLILPTLPQNFLLQNNNINVVLPGQSVRIPVPHPDQTTLAVQPWHQSKVQWPDPQLCVVQNGAIELKNSSENPVNMYKSSKIQARTVSPSEYTATPAVKFPPPAPSPAHQNPSDDNIQLIEVNSQQIGPEIIRYVHEIHSTYREVFNEDLSKGYNHRYGKHIARLNWASNNRPQAKKIQHINYDYETKVLLQKVCDDLTEKGVLGIPQDHNVNIQYCSPSFLVRKPRAKNKSKNDLGPSDVRLVVNFAKINDYLKNLPTPITKPKDIFSTLGKWNYIIVMDLHSGFFQNHMDIDDAEWLGITTPFGGLRFMRRSGQGLLGQSEELDELLCKVLGPEMSNGIVARLADDLYVGGVDPQQTADNYKTVLAKLQAANIKISPAKTKVFLKSVDVLGWVWQQGGFLSPSPHKVNAIKNTKQSDLVSVKDLRSWLGLYKTMLPASPHLTILLHPFDLEVADKDSKEEITWTRDLAQHFISAIKAVDDLQTLYLPHPDDQLLIEVDAAKVNPGLGHTVYAIKNNKKLPVSFHSVKLPPHLSKWMACELEALAFATAIQAEYDLIKESKHPVILSPDSKAVADAINLVKKGNYSSSPRIQSFINNVNRIPITVQLASGKASQNVSSDYQSRHPSSCSAEHCSICTFAADTSASVLLPSCNNVTADSLSNRQAWKKIQEDYKPCKDAKQLLKSGKTPSKQSGKSHSEVRRLCSIAKIAKDDTLVVESRPNKYSTQLTELIIIPQSHIPALLWQLHNTMQHPTKSQLKAHFNKYYYGVGFTAALDQIYEDCFFCATQKKIPNVVQHHSKTEATVPGTHFHADVIRRQSQNIFTIRDHVSSMSAAKIIKSENSADLKQAMIDLVIPLKLQGQCIIRVDNARGFLPLTDDKDHDLKKLNIVVQLADANNVNSNAVIDRACYELEQELKRVEPDGRPLSNTTLQVAVCQLNTRLRRNGQISAFEIHFNRDMNTGDNLNLDYSKIRADQLNKRQQANEKHNISVKPSPVHQNPQQGDIVIVNRKQDKHKANDVFLVTKTHQDQVKMQKILHPHSSQPKLRNYDYNTTSDRVMVARKSAFPTHQPYQSSFKSSVESVTPSKSPLWNPFRRIDEHDSDDDQDCRPVLFAAVYENTTSNDDDQNINDQQFEETNSQQDNILSAFASPLPRSSSSDSEQSYSSPLNVTSSSPATEAATSLTPQPDAYQQHRQWLQNQRAHAARQLLLVNSSSPPSPPLPPAPDKRSLQKLTAKQKIAAIYNQPLPQLDGYITDPSSSSSNTSPDTSASASEHEQVCQHFGFYDQVITDYYDFLDRIDFMQQLSPASSTSWDYEYLHCDDDLQHIFAEPDFNSSFLPLVRRHSC